MAQIANNIDLLLIYATSRHSTHPWPASDDIQLHHVAASRGGIVVSGWRDDALFARFHTDPRCRFFVLGASAQLPSRTASARRFCGGGDVLDRAGSVRRRASNNFLPFFTNLFIFSCF